MADFIPNKHLNGYKLTVSHDPEASLKVKKGYVHEAVTLEHYSFGNGKNHRREKVVLGYVPSRTATPKAARHRIMCSTFGVDRDQIIVRDRDVCQLLTEHLGAAFELVSCRALRGIGLVEHAHREGCTAVYTPEGYDQYLLDNLMNHIKEKKYKMVVITKYDGHLMDV